MKVVLLSIISDHNDDSPIPTCYQCLYGSPAVFFFSAVFKLCIQSH